MTSSTQVAQNLARARDAARSRPRRAVRSSRCCRRISPSWRAASATSSEVAEDDGDGSDPGHAGDCRARAAAHAGGRHHAAARAGRNARRAGLAGLRPGWRAHRPLRQDPPVRRRTCRTPRNRIANPPAWCRGARSACSIRRPGRLGIAVCYDLRFPELFRAMSKQGRSASSCRPPSPCPPARRTGTC